MDAYTYADPVNPNLVCCICRQPFVDPTTASCGHTFCNQCINTALDVSGCCPIDRGSLDTGDLMPAPALVRNMVDELTVHCPNAPLGCTHTAQRHLIPSHVTGCTFIPVPCPSCVHTVLQHNAEPHDGDECKHALALCSTCDGLAPESHTCPARPVECPHCAAQTPHNLLAQHTQTCPAVPTPCPLSTYGCTHTGPASALDDHLASCPFEPLKPYLALSQSRITALERTVAELKHQLDATKKSLGPWFRPANAPTEPDPPRFEFRPLVGRRRVSSPLHTSMFHFDEAEPTTRRRAGSGSNLRVSSTPADMDDPFSHILPPSPTSADHREAVPYIPPLNTSASLEHTLSTLRNGLVSLAASLDMAERRQEVVVTTESLRMHEEVGSMRAIVHGLRMQVSALVMERNVAMMGRMNRGSSSSPSANDRNEERFATETRYYNQHPPPPVNLAVPYSVRRQETNNKL